MLKYSVKRLASSLLTLLIIITVVFVLLRQMPIEGYFDNFEKADQATINAKLTQLGLNDPIPVQLWNFLKNLFKGNKSRSEIVATFLAVLDLCKTNSVTLEDDVNGDNPNVRLLDDSEKKEMVNNGN